LRADGVHFGPGCFGQPEGGVTPGLGTRVVSKQCGKSCLLIVKRAANCANLGLKFCIGGLKRPARVMTAAASASSSSPRCAKTCSPCSTASAHTDSIALATAGGSAAASASLRACSSFHSFSSSLMVVRLPWRISAWIRSTVSSCGSRPAATSRAAVSRVRRRVSLIRLIGGISP
jgi:hypothetical protein